MKNLSRLAALGIGLLAVFTAIGSRPAVAQEGTSTPYQVFYSSSANGVRNSLWGDGEAVTTYDAAATDIPAIPADSEAILVVQSTTSGDKSLVLCVKFPDGGGVNIFNADPVASEIVDNLGSGTAFGGMAITTDSAGAYRLTMSVKAAGTARNIVWGGTGGVPPAPQSSGSLMSALSSGVGTLRNIVWGGTGGVPPRRVTVLAQEEAYSVSPARP